ncbi:hypothetical protein D3C73_1003620 [compost metagenome]
MRFLDFIHPLAFGYFKHRTQAVRHRFIRSKNSEVAVLFIERYNLFQVFAQYRHILGNDLPGNGVIERIVAEIWLMQVFNQVAGISHRVHSHTSVASRQDFGKLCIQTAILIE